MRYKVVVSFLITAILVLGLAAQASSAIIRVKFDSPNNGPGNDWDHAYQTVTTGLAAAVSGDEVWVAKGTYVGCITLKLGVALYGGFVGTETERDQRDWKTNVTILDGNHSGSVVRSPTDATSTTRVDGFTIRNGSGVDGDGLGTCGGGVYCPSSSPTIANNTITHNDVNKYGGGIYCSSGSPVIVDNRICENKVAVANWGVGGGVYCENCTVTICGN